MTNVSMVTVDCHMISKPVVLRKLPAIWNKIQPSSGGQRSEADITDLRKVNYKTGNVKQQISICRAVVLQIYR